MLELSLEWQNHSLTQEIEDNKAEWKVKVLSGCVEFEVLITHAGRETR